MTNSENILKIVLQLMKAIFCTVLYIGLGFIFMMFNATFNNISVILWPSDLLVEENGVPGENH